MVSPESVDESLTVCASAGTSIVHFHRADRFVPHTSDRSRKSKPIPSSVSSALTIDSQEGKKKFDKETTKFCMSLERHLNLSTKKSENSLQEVSNWTSGSVAKCVSDQ